MTSVWPDVPRLEASRMSVYEAIKNHVSVFENDMAEPPITLSDPPAKEEKQGTEPRENRTPRQRSMSLVYQTTPLDFEPFTNTRGKEATMASVPEARLRILSVQKHAYWGYFQVGLLSPYGLRTFERTLAVLVTDTSRELHTWSTLEKVGG